jgi:hypothetical protein
MRPIDIAYFFADPLVQVGRNVIRAKHEGKEAIEKQTKKNGRFV